MSEELTQRKMTDHGLAFGEYEFFPIHSTTLKQYKNLKIIPNIDYGRYEARKPDGLLVDRRNRNQLKVIAVLEYKKPEEFQTDRQKREAVEQCNDLCQVLGAKMGITTDGVVTYWINPNNPDKRNEYKDKTTETIRSYSFILNDDKQRLQKKFSIAETHQGDVSKLDDDSRETYQTIGRILQETSDRNSTLAATENTDPSPLARSVWQSIYISTKDNPTACLYNVVEIFIFKFLSDLGVLRGTHSFDNLLGMYKKEDSKVVLAHYANTCRPQIKALFREGDDHTTIINGTIFVNKDGSPVLSQATLFKETIEKYAKFGDLRNIKKEFKTKLFETFLKQSKDKSRLGQFFTPRKVVKAIVEMADIDKASFLCDPFCGVGGFILEPFQASSNFKSKFIPKNGKISPGIKILGYDTGREDNDEQKRTIILAKANMLIYISDLIERNVGLNEEFSKLINGTFHFLSDSNLGTLKVMFPEDEKPDLIITNPPYITSGVTTLRKQIQEEGLADFYANSGKGVEGLCLKWIISNLKPGGSAFVILPEGIFNVLANKTLRDEIRRQCFINCIISLPEKTFFNTPKKTYILGLKKKESLEEKQDFPVFTYLASTIGELLNINRFEIEDNDLDKAKNLFNQYKGSPKTFKTDDSRCKLQPFERFVEEKYWIIDKWWTNEEKIGLGLLEREEVLTLDEFRQELSRMKSKLEELDEIVDFSLKQGGKAKTFSVTELFDPKKGKDVYTRRYIHDHRGEYPVYSSQTVASGEIGRIDSFDYEKECFTWTTDGVNAGTVFYRNGKFSITTHCGILDLKEEFRGKADFEYLHVILSQNLPSNTLGEGANKRLGINRMREIFIDLPIRGDGSLDLEKQKEIAGKYKKIAKIKASLKLEYDKVLNSKLKLIEGE